MRDSLIAIKGHSLRPKFSYITDTYNNSRTYTNRNTRAYTSTRLARSNAYKYTNDDTCGHPKDNTFENCNLCLIAHAYILLQWRRWQTIPKPRSPSSTPRPHPTQPPLLCTISLMGYNGTKRLGVPWGIRYNEHRRGCCGSRT